MHFRTYFEIMIFLLEHVGPLYEFQSVKGYNIDFLKHFDIRL